MKEPYTGVLSGSVLKVLAMVLMTVDHVAACGLLEGDAYLISRAAGRMAFPLFAFLLSEGCIHTGNLTGYVLRLALFSLLSEIPFDLALYGVWWYPGHQSIFLALTLSAAGCLLWELFRECGILQVMSAICMISCGELLNADYGMYGVFLPLMFYLTARQRNAGTVIGLATSQTPYQYPAYIAIFLYNGQRGFIRGKAKWLFYLYYPVHLTILAVLKGI